jgi:DNA-directed RNA polymerase subunit RPC12/RpoP
MEYKMRDPRKCSSCGKKFDYDKEGDREKGKLKCGKCLAEK